MTSKSEEKILRSIETFFLSYFDFVDQGKFPGKKYKYVRTNLVLGYSPVTRQKHEMGLLHRGANETGRANETSDDFQCCSGFCIDLLAKVCPTINITFTIFVCQ